MLCMPGCLGLLLYRSCRALPPRLWQLRACALCLRRCLRQRVSAEGLLALMRCAAAPQLWGSMLWQAGDACSLHGVPRMARLQVLDWQPQRHPRMLPGQPARRVILLLPLLLVQW